MKRRHHSHQILPIQHATIPRVRVSVDAANVVNEEGDKEGPAGLSMKRKKIIKPFAASTTARTITMSVYYVSSLE